MMGDTAQPSVKFAQFARAFLGETAKTRAMHTGGPLLPLAKPWLGATRRCLRAATAAGSSERFEPVRVHVLAHLERVPDAAVHGDVDARRQRLHRADRAADVELGIRTAEARRVPRAGQRSEERWVGRESVG